MTDKTVVLIHGLWVTTDSWGDFKTAWEDAGWTVLTPTWDVLKGRSAATLNASPPDELGGLTVGRIVDGLQTFIAALPTRIPEGRLRLSGTRLRRPLPKEGTGAMLV